jgi:hypothetical protein
LPLRIVLGHFSQLSLALRFVGACVLHRYNHLFFRIECVLLYTNSSLVQSTQRSGNRHTHIRAPRASARTRPHRQGTLLNNTRNTHSKQHIPPYTHASIHKRTHSISRLYMRTHTPIHTYLCVYTRVYT